MTSMDPDPRNTPDLEPGGGVPPGSTPPESPQTSGLSAPEPSTRHHFPLTGIAAVVVTLVLVAVFAAVIVGVIAAM
ncbi:MULTISPECIES: DUF6480 family protein [Nocardia]|uniref:Uncharacterized protein n=1 Tax=Nocardia coubleae TaxID=356147 RepID=A0A846W133_9NOCA|nr:MULTISPECIES: DUF6480 family protein [Nocardia]MCA2207421.1 DUF6480 family protein [Nocardia rosealba]NKX86387.1 hypothetical protein [Nocardia coubleae]